MPIGVAGSSHTNARVRSVRQPIVARVRAFGAGLSISLGAMCACGTLSVFFSSPNVAYAHHPDDICTDTEVWGEDSMEGYVIHQTTHERYDDGAVLPLGTPLRVTGNASAEGYCQKYLIPHCEAGSLEYRGVVAVNNPYTAITPKGTYADNSNVHYAASKGGIGTVNRQWFDGGTDDPSRAPYVSWETLGGTFKFNSSKNFIHDTTCELTPDEVFGPDFTIYILPEFRCDEEEGENNGLVGNPCDVATGNKKQVESDFAGIHIGLTLTRTYNSLLPVNFGFGHGWASSIHKRLEIFGDKRRVRRGSGVGDVFEDISGNWVGPDDTNYILEEDATGYDVTLRSGAVERYDLDGKIVTATDSVGRVTSYSYDSSDRLETVTGPFGHTLTLAYNANDLISSVTDPAGETISYGYDSEDRLTSVTYQDASVKEYLYENSTLVHALTGIIDENGDRYATYGYGSSYTYGENKVVSTEHATTTNGTAQEKFSIVYNNSATQRTVTDPAGNSWVYTFQTQHDVKKLTSRVSQADSKTISQVFDSNNNLTSRTDEEGRTTTYGYNANNQRTSMTEAWGTAAARTTTYQYLSADEDLITKVITLSVDGSSDREVTTTYDANRNITQIATTGYDPSGSPVSRSTSMQHNSAGQVTQIDGPRTDVSDITTITYNECTTGIGCGQIATITNALGHVTSYDVYDYNGRVLQMTDPNNVVTTYVYDLRGRATSITQTPPSGPSRVTSYTWDDAGQLETVTAPNGMQLTYDYDEAHDLRSITDNQGNQIEYLYDTWGNRTDEDIRDPSAVLTGTLDYTYDLRSRIDTINSAGSVTDLVFDAVGNLTDETDPNSNDTSHDYDPLDRLDESLDALSGVTAYDYDVNDYLTSVEAPNGATTTYSYDDLGNLLSMTSPDTGTTTYTYDAAGNRLTQTDANSVTTTYTYDSLNRLLTVSYPNSSLSVTFTYDAGTNQKGQLTGMTDGSGSTTYTYDVYGNVTQESKTIDSITHVTDYDWDSADLLETITYPSGRSVDYTRNTLGQVTAVDTTYDTTSLAVASSISYEPYGPLAGLTFGNSLVMSRDYDTQYRLTDQTTGSIQDLTFTHDAAGNIDAIGDAVNTGLSQTFTQDALNRIDYEAGAYGTKDYTYDGVGNRLTRVHDDGSIVTQTLTYATNSNLLATHDGNTVTIDAAGNTTADITEDLSFVYDDHNRMVEAWVGSVLKATYTYNGHGQRVKKTEADGDQRTFIFHYGPAGQLIAETVYDDVGALIEERDYIWLDTLPVAQSHREFSGSTITNDEFVYIHADQLETPRLATNVSGTVVWRWDSDAFGLGEADTDPDSDTDHVIVRLRFPGQYYDEKTGLHYNYFRDYDAITGRYSQSDPVGLAGGFNLFAYVEGNPMILVDPYGLWRWGDSLPQGFVNWTAAFGDTLSFGVTRGIREIAGWNDVVNFCSSSYRYGELSAIGLSVGFGGAHLGRAAVNQASFRGGFQQGIRRIFQDNRQWGSVQRTWSQNVGGYKGKYELHHWFAPRSAGGSNAGWNYLPVSSTLNRIMGNGGRAYNSFKGAVISIYGAIPTAVIEEMSKDCNCQ